MSERQARRLQQAMLDALGSGAPTLPELIRRLRVPRNERHAFRRSLQELVAAGRVVRSGRGRYAAAGRDDGRGGRPAAGGPGAARAGPLRTGAVRTGAARAGRRGPGTGRGDPPRDGKGRGSAAAAPGIVSGRLLRNPRGFGFLAPDGGGEDIFLPPNEIEELRDGDRLQVRLARGGRTGRVRGEVVKVLERTSKRVIGIFRAGGGSRAGGHVDAYDRQFGAGIAIEPDGTGRARDGEVVGVELLRMAVRGGSPTGRIVEVLGYPDDPGMDLKTVIHKFGLRTEFPPDVLHAAEAVPDSVSEAEADRREDFRSLPIVTIDGETAKDFDDAIHVRRNADGSWELQVHIADVAHYVKASGPLDQEAYERGTSVYFPGTALPMLPERLSNGICSLNPGVDRLVQSCLMTIDRHGAVVDYRLSQGVIRSAARMTYTEVARILVDNDAPTIDRYRELVPAFRLMEELCGVLNDRRRRRGSIDFDLPEPEIVLAITGEMTGVIALERNVAHRLIEEFMLAANETVALHLWKARVPSLYRIHERPDPRRLEDFDRTVAALGYHLPRPFVSIEPQAFNVLLDMARGRPEEPFLSRLMLRSMKQARYSEKRDMHFGLASSCYTHFTSPIRRYPDLVVHRMLKRIEGGRGLGEREREALEAFLPEAAQRSSQRERTADAAENELVQWKKMAFMAERVGEEYEAFVTMVQPIGLFVELREFFVDGVVPIDALPGDRYSFVETKQIVKGDRHGRIFKMGDRLRVRVDKVNQLLLQIDFSLVEPSPGTTAAPAGRRRRRAR